MSLPSVMSGVVLTGHGGLECLEWRDDLPTPSPGAGDVIVKVRGAAVNNTDINTRVGWYSKSDSDDDAAWGGNPLTFPRIQGIDACGRVVAVGADVSDTRIGQRVLCEPCMQEWNGVALLSPWFFGSECDGGFAQYARIPARYAHAIDSTLSDTELATFPCSYSTAENMLHKADVQPGERVLITGASGGVGSAAVQLCLARGALPVAVTQPSKAKDLASLGAVEWIDRAKPLAPQLTAPVTVVIDLVGGPQVPELLELLPSKGRYAVAGAVAGPIIPLDLRTLYLSDLRLIGCTVLEEGVFSNLVSHIETGRIKPLVGATFDLKDIHAAQNAFAAKQFTGKIALTVPD
jgi:NADPH:quinone reductase-like Zn-dependent oxidoreductase